MSRFSMLFILVVAATTAVPACQPAGEPDAPAVEEIDGMSDSPEAGIEAMTSAFEEAWGAGDAAAIGSHFTVDADFSGPDGSLVMGSEAIAARYAELLAGIYLGSTMEIRTNSIRWLNEDTALLTGTWVNANMPEGSEIPTEGLYTDVVVRSGDVWKIASLRAWYPIAAPGTN